MTDLVWPLCIVLSVGIVLAFALTFVPFYARWSAHSLAARIRIDLPSHLERTVSARLMARERGGCIGALVVTIAIAVSLQSGVDVSHGSSLTLYFIIGAVIAGMGAGAAVAALTGIAKVDADQPRVARSGAVSVRDYLAPFERISARVLVISAVVVLLVTAIAIPSSGGSLFAIAFFAIFGAIALALFEVAGRRIVGISQPAGSTAELVWDDAIRASVLRDLLMAPLILGAYCLLFGVLGVAESTTSTTVAIAGYVIIAVFAIALLVGAAVSIATRPQRYFVDRLWPNLRWSDLADATTEANA